MTVLCRCCGPHVSLCRGGHEWSIADRAFDSVCSVTGETDSAFVHSIDKCVSNTCFPDWPCFYIHSSSMNRGYTVSCTSSYPSSSSCSLSIGHGQRDQRLRSVPVLARADVNSGRVRGRHLQYSSCRTPPRSRTPLAVRPVLRGHWAVPLRRRQRRR